MASHGLESKGDVIAIVDDNFDKVGYTKVDEAYMAKQKTKKQFYGRCTFSVVIVLFMTLASDDSTLSPSFLIGPHHWLRGKRLSLPTGLQCTMEV